MKKLVALMLVVVCIFSITACSKKEEPITAKVIDFELTEEEYAFGVDKNQPELLEKANAFIKQIKEDGTFEEICDRYFGDGEPKAVTSAKKDSSKEQLVVATNAEFAPFEYKKGENYYGIDMEIAQLFAEYLGMELVIDNMDFEAVCLSVGSHKCDIAMAGLTINEERKESVEFTDSYYTASQKVIVCSDDKSFDDCKSAEDVLKVLKGMKDSDKIGVQSGTTGEFYVKGDSDWGFEGLPVECKAYKSGALAVQDMLNCNINAVIIDSAPAKAITEAINKVQ